VLKNQVNMKNKKLLLIIFLFGLIFVAKDLVLAAEKAPQSFLYLTWESDGMAPLTYKAKAMPAEFAMIKVSVQPLIYSKGSYLNSDNWNYQWFVNEELINQGVGLKEVRFIAKDYTRADYEVTVRVFSTVSETPFIKTATINLVKPLVYLKPVNEKSIALNSYNTSENLVELEAVPFFFGSYGLNQLHYSWAVNGYPIADFDNEKSIMVPNIGEENPFSTNIKLTVEDQRDVILRAESALNINFVK